MRCSLAERVSAMIPLVLAYGGELHIRASYGDEQAFRSPWDLFGAEDAQRGVEAARQCVTTAKSVYQHFFPTSEDGEPS